MKEIVKRRWLTDNDNQKIAPKTTIDQILMADGGRFENEWQKHLDNIPYVTPEMFGAKGDGATDDTNAIQKALDANPNNVVFTNHYLISDKLIVPSNINILGLPNNQIINRTLKTCFYILNQENITIDGINYQGTRAPEGSSSEAYLKGDDAINVYNCTKVSLKNLYIKDAAFDGIYIGETTVSKIGTCSHISVDNCIIDNATRNGISITAGNFINLKKCYIYNTHGSAPEAGIDLEPNQGGYTINNTTVDQIYIDSSNIQGFLTRTHTKKGKNAIFVKNSVFNKILSLMSEDIYIDNCIINDAIYSTCDYLKMTNCNVTSQFITGAAGLHEIYNSHFKCDKKVKEIVALREAIFKNNIVEGNGVALGTSGDSDITNNTLISNEISYYTAALMLHSNSAKAYIASNLIKAPSNSYAVTIFNPKKEDTIIINNCLRNYTNQPYNSLDRCIHHNNLLKDNTID